MVLPAIIGGIASLGSGLLGARAQNQAMMYNYMIDMYNARQRRQERFEAKQEAGKNKKETQLGYTDADGNRVRFVQGKGWVTELAPQSARIRGMERDEREKVLAEDLPMRRSGLKRNDRRSREEDVVSRTLLDEFRRARKVNPDSIASQLITAATQGINEGYDKSLGTMLRSAARTGITDTSKLTSGVNKERAGALASAIAAARVQAMQMADQQYEGKRGQVANLYNMFASRASALPETQFAPMNIDASGMTSQFVNQMAGNNSAGMQAAMMRGPEMSFIEPQMGMANAFGQAGMAIAGGLNNMGASQGYNNAQQTFGQMYLPPGAGGYGPEQGGVYGYSSAQDRMKLKSPGTGIY
jgi:hypothetical protein